MGRRYLGFSLFELAAAAEGRALRRGLLRQHANHARDAEAEADGDAKTDRRSYLSSDHLESLQQHLQGEIPVALTSIREKDSDREEDGDGDHHHDQHQDHYREAADSYHLLPPLLRAVDDPVSSDSPEQDECAWIARTVGKNATTVAAFDRVSLSEFASWTTVEDFLRAPALSGEREGVRDGMKAAAFQISAGTGDPVDGGGFGHNYESLFCSFSWRITPDGMQDEGAAPHNLTRK